MSIPYPTVYAEEQNELDDNVGMENDAQMTAMIDEILAKKAIRTHSTPVALPLASGMRNREGMKGSALPEHSKLREEVERRRKQRITSLAPKRVTNRVKKPFNETKEEKKRAKKLLKLQKKAVDRGLKQLEDDLKAKEKELEATNLVNIGDRNIQVLKSEIADLKKRIKKNKKVSKKKLEERLQMDTESVVRLLKLDPKVFNTFLKHAEDVIKKKPVHLEDISKIPTLETITHDLMSDISKDILIEFPPDIKTIETNLNNNFKRANDLLKLLPHIAKQEQYNIMSQLGPQNLKDIINSRYNKIDEIRDILDTIHEQLNSPEIRGHPKGSDYAAKFVKLDKKINHVIDDVKKMLEFHDKYTSIVKNKGKLETTGTEAYYKNISDLEDKIKQLRDDIVAKRIRVDSLKGENQTQEEEEKWAEAVGDMLDSEEQLRVVLDDLKDLKGSGLFDSKHKKHRKRKV